MAEVDTIRVMLALGAGLFLIVATWIINVQLEAFVDYGLSGVHTRYRWCA